MTVRAGLCEDENNYGLEVHRLGRIVELGWSLRLEVKRGRKRRLTKQPQIIPAWFCKYTKGLQKSLPDTSHELVSSLCWNIWSSRNIGWWELPLHVVEQLGLQQNSSHRCPQAKGGCSWKCQVWWAPPGDCRIWRSLLRPRPQLLYPGSCASPPPHQPRCFSSGLSSWLLVKNLIQEPGPLGSKSGSALTR